MGLRRKELGTISVLETCYGKRFCYSFLLPGADKKFQSVFPLEDCLEV